MPHHSQCTVVSDKLESGSPPKSPDLSPALTIPSSKASESPDRTISNVPSMDLEWPGLAAMTKDEEANLIPFVRWVVKHRTDQSSCAAYDDKPVGKLAPSLPVLCSQLRKYQQREFWTVFYHHFYSIGCPPDLAMRDFVDGAKLIDWDKKWGRTTILGHSHTYLFLAHDQHQVSSIIPSGYRSRNARIAMLSKLGLSCPEPKCIPRTFAAAAKAKAQRKDLAFAFKDNGSLYRDRKALALTITMESREFDGDGVVQGEDRRCALEFSYRVPGAESLMRDDATVGDALRAITMRYCVTGCCLVAANPRPVHMTTLICELKSVCDIVKAPLSASLMVVKAGSKKHTYEEVVKNLSFEPAEPTNEADIALFGEVSSEIVRPGQAVALSNGQPPAYARRFDEESDRPLLSNWRSIVKFGLKGGFSQFRFMWHVTIRDYGVGTTRLVQIFTCDPQMSPANVLRRLFAHKTIRRTDCFTLVRLLPDGNAEVADLRLRRHDEYHESIFLHYTDSLVLYGKPRLATKQFTRDPADTAYPVHLHCGGNTTKLTFKVRQPTEASIAKPLLVYLCRLWNLLPSVVAPWMVCVDQEAPPLPGRISITKVISYDGPRFEVFVNVQMVLQQAPTKDVQESLRYSPKETKEWNEHVAICHWMHASSDSELPFDKSMCTVQDHIAITIYRRRLELFYGVETCKSDNMYCCVAQDCTLEHRCVYCDSSGHGLGGDCRSWSSLIYRNSDVLRTITVYNSDGNSIPAAALTTIPVRNYDASAAAAFDEHAFETPRASSVIAKETRHFGVSSDQEDCQLPNEEIPTAYSHIPSWVCELTSVFFEAKFLVVLFNMRWV